MLDHAGRIDPPVQESIDPADPTVLPISRNSGLTCPTCVNVPSAEYSKKCHAFASIVLQRNEKKEISPTGGAWITRTTANKTYGPHVQQYYGSTTTVVTRDVWGARGVVARPRGVE